MSEDFAPPPAAPTPTGNQNLIIGLVLGAGVLLLSILFLNMKNNGSNSSGGSAELDRLRNEISDRRGFINEERRRLGLPPLGTDVSGQSVEALASRIDTDTTDLLSLVRQMQQRLDDKDSRLANTDTQFTALTTQNTDLIAKLAQLQGSEQDAESLRGRLATAQSLYDVAQKDIDGLQTKLLASVSPTQVTTLQQQISALRQQQEESLLEQDQLKDEVVTLAADAASLRAEKNELLYELQKARGLLARARLFVESADSLPVAAKALYARLAKCETLSGEGLTTEYGKIESDINARVVDTIGFQSGESRINLDKIREIRLAAEKSGAKSFFLVVGYASKTGSFDVNRTISSERASTIAGAMDFNKQPEQNVQAVFLGQTDRFSKKAEENQICEIWEIRQ